MELLLIFFLLLATIGVMIATRSRYRWLAVFLCVHVVGLALQISLLEDNYSFYVLRRCLLYILALAAVNEQFHAMTDRELRISYLLVPLITFAAILFPPYGLFYYLPRLPLHLTFALLLPLAIRKKNLILSAFSTYGVWFTVTDVLKLFQTPQSITDIQQILDPWFMLAFFLMLFIGVAYPYLSAAWQALRSQHRRPSNVVPFPQPAGHAELREEDVNRLLDQRMLEFEQVMKTAAETAQLHNKELINKNDIAALLGIAPSEVDEVLDRHQIERHYITADKWVIRKSVLYDALLLDD